MSISQCQLSNYIAGEFMILFLSPFGQSQVTFHDGLSSPLPSVEVKNPTKVQLCLLHNSSQHGLPCSPWLLKQFVPAIVINNSISQAPQLRSQLPYQFLHQKQMRNSGPIYATQGLRLPQESYIQDFPLPSLAHY